jgi:hypothetical protein
LQDNKLNIFQQAVKRNLFLTLKFVQSVDSKKIIEQQAQMISKLKNELRQVKDELKAVKELLASKKRQSDENVYSNGKLFDLAILF